MKVPWMDFHKAQVRADGATLQQAEECRFLSEPSTRRKTYRPVQ